MDLPMLYEGEGVKNKWTRDQRGKNRNQRDWKGKLKPREEEWGEENSRQKCEDDFSVIRDSWTISVLG